MKHTKGPWYWVEYAGFIELQSGDYYGDPCLLHMDDDPNAEANATLMAAAPDLLEALESCLQILEQTKSFREANSISGGDTFINYAIDQAKDTIKKATL